MKSILSAVVGATLALSAIEADAQATPGERQVSLTIESTSLATALDKWAQQSGFQIFVQDWEGAKNLPARSLKGTFTAQDALEQLLAGTSLTYVWISDKAVSIRKKMPQTVPTALQRTGLDGQQSIPVAKFSGDGAGGASTPLAAAPGSDEGSHEVRLRTEGVEEIFVTGTHIHGVPNPTSPVQVYDRDAIARTGRPTTQEFLKTITANFKGGDAGTSEDGVLNGRSGQTNLESASSVNLRGLGANSTLVLLNGHRMAPSAYGSAVDVSIIPLDAIERVEVVTDGASAIYGADAVGGVVNFILRTDYDGAETSLRGGGTSDGGRGEYGATQTFGGQWTDGGGLATLAYRHADALATTQRSFTESAPSPTDLFPSRDEYTALASVHHRLADTVTITGDALYGTTRQARNYDNGVEDHFQKADVDSLSTSATLEWAVASDWRVSATGTYGRLETEIESRYAPDHDDYVNGAPEIDNDFKLSEMGANIDGSLFSIGGGSVKMAAGATYRSEEMTSSQFGAFPSEDRFKRHVGSAFGELMVPLVSQVNALSLVRGLTLSLAIRYDDYSDFGSTTNPKFGLSWEPWNGLRFRASSGTSFRAPSFDQISQQISNRFMFAFPGFTQPDGLDRPTLLLLSSPTLVPEESRNINVGVEFNSPTVPLTVSVDYYRIVYDDRLVNPPFDTSALLHPEIYGPVIGQFSSGEATAFINEQIARGYEFFDLAGEGTDGIQYSYIRGLVNASRVRQNGLDLAARYVIGLGDSELGLQAQATFIDEIRTAFCSSCTSTNILDIYGEPLRRRLRAGVSWEREGNQLNFAVNYLNHYRDTTAQPAARIGSWTTVDLNYRYEPEFLSGITLAISAINLLDREPPKTVGVGAIDGIRYDSANADPLGRTISLQIQKVWGRR